MLVTLNGLSNDSAQASGWHSVLSENQWRLTFSIDFATPRSLASSVYIDRVRSLHIGCLCFISDREEVSFPLIFTNTRHSSFIDSKRMGRHYLHVIVCSHPPITLILIRTEQEKWKRLLLALCGQTQKRTSTQFRRLVYGIIRSMSENEKYCK